MQSCIVNYKHSILGAGGRERLAAELGWTLAGCSGRVTTPKQVSQVLAAYFWYVWPGLL